MSFRIEVFNKVEDARANIRLAKFKHFSFGGRIKKIFLSDNYLFEVGSSLSEQYSFGNLLINPVTHKFLLSSKFDIVQYPDFDFAVEIGYLPAVTDNIGNTVREMISSSVYSSQTTFIKGKLSRKEVIKLASSLYNPLIQRARIKNHSQFVKDKTKAMSFYKSELKEYPHPRSLDGIEVLAKKRGMEVGLKYAEAFMLLREINK